jgi:hypothetical protein
MNATDNTSAILAVEIQKTGFFSRLMKAFVATAKDGAARTGETFWRYTEANGKADISSFEGVL